MGSLGFRQPMLVHIKAVLTALSLHLLVVAAAGLLLTVE